MASETLGDSDEDLNSRGRCRWTENSKVYTRRIRRKPNIPSTVTTETAAAPTLTTRTEVSSATVATEHSADDTLDECLHRHEETLSAGPSLSEGEPVIQHGMRKESESKKLGNASSNGKEIKLLEVGGDSSPLLNGKEVNQLPQHETPNDNGSDDVNDFVRPLVVSRIDDRIRFSLSKATSKDEVMDLMKKLECELDQIRGLVKRVELKQSHIVSHGTQISDSILSNNSNYIGPEDVDIAPYSHPQHQQHTFVKMSMTGHQKTRPNGLMRVKSDIGTRRPLEPRSSYGRQLSVAVMENNEYVEKEKRTPKANQYYRNSEFLLGKDRLPPENNKRLKTNSKKRGGNAESGFALDKSRNQAFRSCSSLLQRLMKHKYGWVFNEPVDAKALGLLDYHDIIKHPMDLGTIKSRFAQNWYKSPREFAEDVRLVFHNAMTYNPKGQDVHVMAEELLQIFNDRMDVIEIEYNHYSRHQTYPGGVFLTPPSRKAAPQTHFGPPVAPLPSTHGFVPSSVTAPHIKTPDTPKIQRPHIGRVPAQNKPKAKDPDKRDMTYEEKQRLSNHLQGLPHEKLDAIIQIIKKRNTTLSQNDDEIEVDIDSVDPETLWELDRFVTNYKKSLSKNKRKAELALQARMGNHNDVSKNSNSALTNALEGSRAAFEKSIPVEGERQVYSQSRSSSSSSSSSDSGSSSSSDSDSDSSSADGSDAGNSPGT